MVNIRSTHAEKWEIPSMTVTAELCEKIVASTYDDLTPEAIAAARRLVLDGLSITLAGT